MKKMMTALLAMAFVTSANAAEMKSNSGSTSSSSTMMSSIQAAAPLEEKGAMLMLPDGTEVSKMEVIGVLSIMRAIALRNPPAVSNVVKEAYDPQMALPPGFKEKLTKIGILNEDGTFAPHVQEIIKTFWTVDGTGKVSFVRHGKGMEQSMDSMDHSDGSSGQ